ncbi:MAG: hypothetical protein EXX96DRAFT_578194, partial [Benjaminiella poitrasii]
DFTSTVNQRLDKLETAFADVARLEAALAESERARKELESRLAAVSSSSSSPGPAPSASGTGATKKVAKASPPLSSSSGAPVVGKATGSYAAAAAKPPAKKKKASSRPPPLHRAAAIVSRVFGKPSGIPPGYQFVYYPCSVRRPLKDIRRTLQGIGLNNARVLDIQYPVGNVTSFLLHNDYILEFTTAFHKVGGGSPLLDFDPLDPANLRDPKYASLPPDLRVQKAREVENLRCLRAHSFVRRALRVSVARSFLEREHINRAQFDAILAKELAARSAGSSPPPPKQSPEAKKLAAQQWLQYLSFLLHLPEEQARLLAYAPPPPTTGASDGDGDVVIS